MKNEPKTVEVFPDQDDFKKNEPVKEVKTNEPETLHSFNSLDPLKEEKVKEPVKEVKKVTVKPKANVKNTRAKRGSKSKTGR